MKCCDECIFYYYSDLRDVCILLKAEIPYSDAIEEKHKNCPLKTYEKTNKTIKVEFK